ncbi:MAG: glycosyltransferase family 4 protein [Alphaproteobacteria bacterium]
MSAPLTVAQIVPALDQGGVERGTIDIARALVDAGHKAVVVSQGGKLVAELDAMGATHITIDGMASKNPMTILGNVGRLVKVLKAQGVDVVHARSRAPAWSAYRACNKLGMPFVTTFHAPYNFSNEWKRRYNSVMSRGKPVIAISRFVQNHIIENYGLERSDTRLIHRGVDMTRFALDQVNGTRVQTLADAWHVLPDRKIILMPGRLTRWKGQSVVIEALGRLPQDVRDSIHCVFTGSDQGREHYRAELEQAVEQHALGEVVRFMDHCSDMPAACKLADIVISASTDPEGFGRVVAEAHALGKPAIVPDHGGGPEIILEGQTGWAVPPSDPEALADAITKALSLDDAQRAKLAQTAIQRVADNFTNHEMCRRTLAVYQEAAARNSATA